jgi:NitT/TauT family transport system permease protein
MTNLASSEAELNSAAREAGDQPGLLIAMRALFLALVLAAWQGAVAIGLADAAFVSTPVGVAQSLWQMLKSGEIFPNLGTTIVEIVVAFVASVVFGIASAVVLDRNNWLDRILSPFLTALNSMPRIALGPLFILWFGIGIASKIVLAFSLGYFIMLLSTLGGLKNVDRDLLLMSRLFGASELRLFRHVRLP